MTSVLSPNTQAILLLTAPLLVGKDSKANTLSASEYRKLARHLRASASEPAALLTSAREEILRGVPWLDGDRVEGLLARGFQLSQALERWHTRALWVVSRADPEYPKRLKSRLREDSPPVLYGCGDPRILNSGGLAVVGSRKVDDALLSYTMNVGGLAASAGQTVVSGGARGVDQAAMRGALEAGGRAIGVLADRLERASLERSNRDRLLAQQLVLISPYDPMAGFNVGNAMSRNKLIYALADAALVVNSDLGKGGTWAGAVEQLEKLRLVPVFVRTGDPASAGLEGLEKKGALPWPDPEDADAFQRLAEAGVAADGAKKSEPTQLSFASSGDGAGRVEEPDTEYRGSTNALRSEPEGGKNGTSAVKRKRQDAGPFEDPPGSQ
ncbi:MAG: DNA-protecting protein DprA [Candidatus Eisenbacteria bacterium]|uniref:DNA-protecting protein DprA n=1 Tax=Eiseniibacteriota bacterium TaxID=2212470 RepID=A0A956SFY4_UNCEI|nr:DNA-protecting protein DprA [Candidatus Eisenbacteria bacterium]